MKKIVAIIVLFLLCQSITYPNTLDTESYHLHTEARSNGYNPIANVSISVNESVEDNLQFVSTKTVSNVDWDVYRILLPEEGSLTVNFDGSNSNDLGSSDPLVLYQWKVFFDAPYGDDTFNLDGHVFNETESSNGLWSYSFQNQTVDSTESVENQIRVELTVTDYEGNVSEKFRTYFIVGGMQSEMNEPVIELEVQSNATGVQSDNVYVNGTVISGAGFESDVYVEITFEEDWFNGTSLELYYLGVEHLWDRTNSLTDGDTFSLMLSIESLKGNTSFSQAVYIKIYEMYPDYSIQYSTVLTSYSVIVPFIDSDNDGVADDFDAYPNDPTQAMDEEPCSLVRNEDAPYVCAYVENWDDGVWEMEGQVSQMIEYTIEAGNMPGDTVRYINVDAYFTGDTDWCFPVFDGNSLPNVDGACSGLSLGYGLEIDESGFTTDSLLPLDTFEDGCYTLAISEVSITDSFGNEIADAMDALDDLAIVVPDISKFSIGNVDCSDTDYEMVNGWNEMTLSEYEPPSQSEESDDDSDEETSSPLPFVGMLPTIVMLAFIVMITKKDS